MTRTASRLAALDAISRERELTDAEQREVLRLAHLERQCARRRERYASDPAYRETVLRRVGAWKGSRYRNDPEFRAAELARNRAYREARA